MSAIKIIVWDHVGNPPSTTDCLLSHTHTHVRSVHRGPVPMVAQFKYHSNLSGAQVLHLLSSLYPSKSKKCRDSNMHLNTKWNKYLGEPMKQSIFCYMHGDIFNNNTQCCFFCIFVFLCPENVPNIDLIAKILLLENPLSYLTTNIQISPLQTTASVIKMINKWLLA